jgi:hypothetical protein
MCDFPGTALRKRERERTSCMAATKPHQGLVTAFRTAHEAWATLNPFPRILMNFPRQN